MTELRPFVVGDRCGLSAVGGRGLEGIREGGYSSFLFIPCVGTSN